MNLDPWFSLAMHAKHVIEGNSKRSMNGGNQESVAHRGRRRNAREIGSDRGSQDDPNTPTKQ